MDAKTLRRMTIDYYLDIEILYKRSFYWNMLRCLNEKETKQALQEVYKGIVLVNYEKGLYRLCYKC
jgi:hypothetical protein